MVFISYFLGSRKAKSDINKTNSEIELTLTQKFILEIEAAEKFRKLLIEENESLKKELFTVKQELSELKILIKSGMCGNAPTCKNRI